MIPYHLFRFAGPAAIVLTACLAAQSAQAQQPSVLESKEAQLPVGSRPVWESSWEKALPRPDKPSRVRTGHPLPLPPPDGYRVPAEFERVSAFLVTQAGWADWILNPEIDMLIALLQQGTAAQGAGAIALTKDAPADFESYLANKGVDLSRVHVIQQPEGLDTKWIRDFGPLGLFEGGLQGHLAFVDLHYSDLRPHDDAVPSFLASTLGMNRYGVEGKDHTPPDDVKLYLEGGNYQTDGKGTCIVSNDIPSDNKSKGNAEADTLAEAEAILQQYLGCKKTIWLTPPPNSGTGHVDMYAKLLTPTDILVINFPEPSGNSGEADAVVEQAVALLQTATNFEGESYTIHRVDVPPINLIWTYKTYTNSVLLNKVVLVPTYGSSTLDQGAIDAYQKILGPSYTVVGIDSSKIVDQGGAVHCTTMQIPSACGNGVIDKLLFEECDGDDLAGKTCEGLGLPSGKLKCRAEDCLVDTSACVGVPDSGLEASLDAESGVETGAGAEAGIEAGEDRANETGFEAALEAFPTTDSAADSSDTQPPADSPVASEDGGCGCRAVRSEDLGPRGFSALAAIGLLCGMRRRRGREALVPRPENRWFRG